MPKTGQPQTYRILLLEDDEVDFLSIRRALQRSLGDFHYDRATLLSDVETFLGAAPYDIVITDMNLPDSNGLETIRSLLKLVGKIPIVILSDTQDDAVALEAVQAGAQDFIPKQYISDEGLIHRTLRHAIERYSLKMGLERTRNRERYLAHYDQCTSLPNRVLFLDRIEQAVIQAKRNKNQFAVFFVDLDRFKLINDTLGHEAGDNVLKRVGSRMKSIVRDSDTVARFGGDEFILILQLSDDDKAMKRLADKIIQSINEPISFDDHTCNVGASIGIACYPRDGEFPENIIKHADMAMYEAKGKGRNQSEFFSPELFDQKSKFFSLETSLRAALADPDRHFELHYQPRVELKTQEVTSVEALIRWNHPTLGITLPEDFVSLAEDSGLIEQIDEWVFEQVCKKSAEWKNLGTEVKISVNISARSFNRLDFLEQVVGPQFKKYSIEKNSIEIEITEGVLLADTIQIIERLHELKDLGITLAIDDFGTGFSSLNYLRKFPIDTLKIDGSFICDIESLDAEKSLLKAIIALGDALGMNVVAEGLETQAQKDFLTSLSCTEAQGFYLCKPDINWAPDKKINNIRKQKIPPGSFN